MHKKRVWRQTGRRWMAALLAAGVMAGAMPMNLQATEILRQTADSENWIASPVETVYPNVYSGTARSMDFNDYWKFNYGDADGASGEVYDDSGWRTLNLPHDYSVEQEYSASNEAESGYLPGGIGWYRKSFMLDSSWEEKRVSIEFDGVYMNAEVYLNGHLLGSHPYGYTSFAFELPADKLKFDGENVIAVKVNHQTPSSRWYSGSGIYRDVKLIVTDQIHVDRHGVTVLTPNEENAAGNLTIKTVVKNHSGAQKTGIKVSHTIREKGSDLIAASVESSELTVEASGSVTTELPSNISGRKLWNVWDQGEQNLYVVRTEIKDSNDQVLDTYDTTFGFRYYNFDSATGFSFNGQKMKLRGVCMHHDQGALGSEAWHRAIERQVEKLKEMGCNAIRVTHNPAAEILVEICNEKGMLVIDEAFDGWSVAKNGNSHDFSESFMREIGSTNTIEGGEPDMKWAEYSIRSMVGRAKNAPAMLMWSLGNEIIEGARNYAYGGGPDAANGQKPDGSNKSYADVAADIIGWIKAVDDTRPVTFGDNKLKGGNGNMIAVADAIHAAGGVIGFNYATNNEIKNNSKQGWRVYGSETASAVNSRGVYNYKGGATKTADQNLTSYDKSHVGWGITSSEEWYRTINMDANAGMFTWTGFDYLGEPTPWNGTGSGSTTGDFNVAPKSSYFGILETTGFEKDRYYFYRSVWNTKSHTLHILPTWNREDVVIDSSGKVEVVVYSDAHKVELFLNGQSQGEKIFQDVKSENGTGIYTYRTVQGQASGHTALYRTWMVPYEEGTLTAKAYDKDGNEIRDAVGRSTVKTTTAASKLTLSADRTTITADGKDLSYITIDVEDAQGNFVNGAEPVISVSVSGDGKLMALDNGRQNDHTSYYTGSRQAHRGKLLAIVQSTKEAGSFTVTARADGLTTGTVEVQTEAATQDGSGTGKYIQSLEYSRLYYVKKGTNVDLFDTVKVNYSDGTSENETVSWEAGSIDTSTVGVVTKTGTIGSNIRVTVRVNVLEAIEALLNYSTAVKVGADLNLPASRPAIMADGTLLDAYFPVEWDESTVDATEPGIYEVTGTADVFGKTLRPTATVRVSEGEVLRGSNAAPNVVQMFYGDESTTALGMIKDEATEVSGESWKGTGVIKYRYDTAVNMKEVVLHMKDTAPTSSTMSVEWSADGSIWQSIDAKITNEKEAGKTIRTYDFDLVPAVWVKLEFKRPVDLLEAELIAGIPTFDIGAYAGLEDLVVDGRVVPQAALNASSYGVESTSLSVDKIDAVGKDNASVTILPANGGKIRILTESEDHVTRETFEVILGQSQAAQMDAADDSHDYPYQKTTAVAGSEQTANNQQASKAVDGDPGTIWHTNWSQNLANSPEKRYIELTLEEETEINALRYQPREDGPNGVITGYVVKVKGAQDSEWKQVDSGEWANNNAWKLSSFQATRAKYVRLEATTTTSDTEANKFVSAREIRVCVPYVDLYTAATAVLPDQEYNYTGSAVKPEPVVALKEGNATLTKDVDYTLSYKNNVEPGENATVWIEGKGNYGGILRLNFAISEAEVEITALEPVNATTEIGAVPNLPGTVTATLSGGSKEEREVVWDLDGHTFVGALGDSFEVEGTVEGTDLKAQATVVLAEAVIPTTNIALNASKTGLPLAIAYVSSGADNPFNATDGKKDFVTNGSKKIWSDWERNTYHTTENWMGVIFGKGTTVTRNTINKVSVGFMEEDGSGSKVSLPASYKIEYYVGPENYEYVSTLSSENNKTGNGFVRDWTVDSALKNAANWREVEYTGTKPAVPSTSDFKKMVDITFAPVTTSAMRISLTPQANQWTGLEEFEVYGYERSGNSSFTVTDIKVGDRSIKDEITAGEAYKVTLSLDDELPVVTATATDNASVTVVQAANKNGVARVTIQSEDKSKTEVYLIQFESKDIEVGEIALTTKAEAGKKLDIAEPEVRSDLAVESGWQMKKKGSTEWESFDAETVLDASYDGAVLRYHADNGENQADSNEITLSVEKEKEEVKEKEWIFTDVSQDNKEHWMYKAVRYVYNTTGKEGGKSLMGAVGVSTDFQPNRTLDRAMMATILHRWAGEPEDNYPNKFTDIKSGYYVTAVLWANQMGIVNGKGGSNVYAPGDQVTRAEIAKMLYLYGTNHLGLTLPQSGDLSKFADVKLVTGKWSEGFLKWATSAGIISGVTRDGKVYLDPNEPATRAQCAKMIQWFGEKVIQ